MAFLVFAGVGCTDNFEELNTDIKNPSTVPAEPLFSNAVVNYFDLMSEASVNSNVFRLYAQYWAQTTYPDESQYNMSGRDIPGTMWDVMYRDVLRDLDEAKIVLADEAPVGAADIAVLANKRATIDMMKALAYFTLVDIFGDVPFTEALDSENIQPAYDDAKTVYTTNIANLQAAVAAMDGSAAGFDANTDPVYQGDVAAWKKFGNSLMLRLGMRLADTDDAAARALVTSAVDGGVFTSAADDFAITYYSSAPNTNPLYDALVLSGRNDFVPANTTVDMMNTLEDPRRALWFDLNGLDDYIGGTYGTANAYASFAHLGPVFEEATLAGTLMSYSEIRFLLAEAAARGFGVDGTDEEHYNAAITASIMEWGGDQAMADAYLANADVAYGAADWKTQIGTQKWLSLFNNGFEGWTTWRLFDMDFFNLPAVDGLTFTQADIPRRLIYPADEPTLNGSSYSAAAAKYDGDSAKARLFWDAN